MKCKTTTSVLSINFCVVSLYFTVDNSIGTYAISMNHSIANFTQKAYQNQK